MSALLYAIQGSALGKGTRDGTKHGGPPPRGAPPSAEVIPQPSLARVWHSIQDGDGCLRGMGMDMWRTKAICCIHI